MIKRIHQTVRIIDEQMLYWLPNKAFVAYSGGKDSAVLMDIVARLKHKRVVGAMCIDTELSADGWLSMVKRHCASVGMPCDIARGSGWSWYQENVLDYGFGYTPNQHTIYYRMLKERAIGKHLKFVKVAHRDRILYFTGIRRAESAKRSNAPVNYRHGSRITVNPLLDWQDHEVRRYLEVVARWWHNPYYRTVGNSGDCLCGWTCKNSAFDVRSHHPEIGERLENLSNEAVGKGLWAYGTRPSDVRPTKMDDEEMPHDSLCTSCTR